MRLALNLGSGALVAVVVAFTVRHFMHSGWPLHHASILWVLAAAGLFLVSYACKALGWSRLFAADKRPDVLALACAGGAASITGIALPGRFDEAVRIAVVRRYRSKRRAAGIGGLCLSLVLLGLIDSAALTPLAAASAGVTETSGLLRAGLIVVAVAGIAAAALVLFLPRIARLQKLVRFRLAGWVREHCACPREASKAWLFVSASWLLRGTALFVLLHALAIGASVPLALAFLCASAASAALPIAPAGAATQAGAGAAMLMASGVHTSQAVAFAVSAQALVILVGAGIVVCATIWHAGRRFAPVRA